LSRARKTKKPTEEWVIARVQTNTINIGVTKNNFEDAKRIVKINTCNEINLEMQRYSSGKERSIQRDQRRAGLFQNRKVRLAWEEGFDNHTNQLKAFAIRAVDELFEKISQDGFTKASAYWDIEPTSRWTPLANKPLAPNAEMSPIEAEHWVTNLLLYLGASGAKTTQYSQDGGIDCLADKYVAQVKHLSKPVSVGAIREIFAVGVSKGKTPLIFSKSGFTSAAIDFAIEYHVLLFAYLPLLRGLTKTSRLALEKGLMTEPEVPSEGLRRIEKRDRSKGL
jgi:hypothetical protein